MLTLEEITKEIESIKQRNKTVEANKAWETSVTRKITLVIFTYIVVCLALITIHNPAPLVNAIIPSLGFFLSTLTLPFIKKYWLEHIYNKNKI